ncbi:MAG: hypothetical protein WD077_03295 [Bacteroidia bacterium]
MPASSNGQQVECQTVIKITMLESKINKGKINIVKKLPVIL